MLENVPLEELVEMAREALLLDDWDDRGVCVVLSLRTGPFMSSREQARTLLRLLLSKQDGDSDTPFLADFRLTS